MSRSILLALLGCLGTSLLSAAPIVSWGQGSAVTSVDRGATFSTVVTGTDLIAYTENGLSITIPQVAFVDYIPGQGFSGGFHYPSGGASAPTLIQTTDSLLIYAVEMHVGSGYSVGDGTAYFAWDTWRGGSQTGSGYFGRELAVAQVFGLADPQGFDLLRIVNYFSLSNVEGGVSPALLNALAIDNLRVQLQAGQPVGEIPEPGTLWMAGAALLFLLAHRLR
jgi:hypothetical protein